MNSNNVSMVRKTETGRLRALLMEHRQPIILLGAGASIKSGVPDARETVNRAAKWAWCKEHGRLTEDPSVVSSDWQPWLQNLSWFRKDIGLADQYPVAIDKLLGIGADRLEFFQQIISRGVKPSEGYQALARIMSNGWIATALTTNFDHCLYRAVNLLNVPPLLVEIKTPSDWVRFNAMPANPQLIHLHGSVEHYSDMNLTNEVAEMNPDIVERLRPLLRDHPLIVIGYRGMEASVMINLLYEQSDYTNSFHHGVFWCDLERNMNKSLAPMVSNFADRIGSNFNRVPIEGFDHLLKVDLYDQLVATRTVRKPLGPPCAPMDFPPDMCAFDSGTYTDLDQQFLFQRLKQYADKHSEPAPDRFDAEWVAKTAEAKKLTLTPVEKPKTVRPTLAGWVMFAHNPTPAIPHAVVRFTARGPENWLRHAFGEDADLQPSDSKNEFIIEREIGGTLWNQLDTLLETTALLNTSFLLKEAKSRSVTIYDPLALKEMIVNALVHRDYGKKEPIMITMTPSQIETISPGGLTSEVAAKTGGKTIEDLIRSGSRGELKGYRNPVISDLFYGSNEMERSGSGLSDMLQRTIDNNGDAHFHSTKGNKAFHVVIFARPEGIDEITRTAVADQSDIVRFTTNLVEFVALPNCIWHAGTTSKSASGLHKKGFSLPSGYVQDGRFFSFYDLSHITSNLITPFDEADIEELTIEELLNQRNGHNILRKLLHDSFNEHLRSLGLMVDGDRRRAYFPRGEEPDRKITYQGRIKRATRTIVKARTGRDSDDIIYYEHKSFSYSITTFGIHWALFINPGYVFTRDGQRRYLERERTNILSTKRAARDFNTNVMHDVTFWMAYLSEEADGVFALKTEQGNELSDYAPIILLNNAFPGIVFSSSAFDNNQYIEDEFYKTLSELTLELEWLAFRENDKLYNYDEYGVEGHHSDEEDET